MTERHIIVHTHVQKRGGKRGNALGGHDVDRQDADEVVDGEDDDRPELHLVDSVLLPRVAHRLCGWWWWLDCCWVLGEEREGGGSDRRYHDGTAEAAQRLHLYD